MRAAVLREFGAGLEVTEVADPTPGPGEVVVRTRAAGVCRTDLKVVDGLIPTVTPPLIPGHELAGEVVALGRDVTGTSTGARVLVGLDLYCGQCGYCRRGELDHCNRLRRLGMEVDGALAEYVKVPVANLVELPDGLSFPAAATIADAIASPYHALRRANLRPGQTVAVYGLGGLGLAAVQIARLSGAEAIGIARTPARRELAEDLGATWTVDPGEGHLDERIRELTGGLGVDVFVDLVGIEGSIDLAVRSCRKGGRVVVLGYSVTEAVAPMLRLVYDEVSVGGSRGSTRADLLDVVGLVARGRIEAVVAEEVGLDEVGAVLDRLREGSTIGRSVVVFDS